MHNGKKFENTGVGRFRWLYQSFIKNSKNGMYLPFTAIDGQSQFVTNEEEFIWAVITNDESPRKVEWIDSMN